MGRSSGYLEQPRAFPGLFPWPWKRPLERGCIRDARSVELTMQNEDQRARNKSSGSHDFENRTYSVNMRAVIIRNAMTKKQNPFKPTRRNSG